MKKVGIKFWWSFVGFQEKLRSFNFRLMFAIFCNPLCGFSHVLKIDYLEVNLWFLPHLRSRNFCLKWKTQTLLLTIKNNLQSLFRPIHKINIIIDSIVYCDCDSITAYKTLINLFHYKIRIILIAKLLLFFDMNKLTRLQFRTTDISY